MASAHSLKAAHASSNNSEDLDCPLCMEKMDFSDRHFRPCPCAYQICQFCYHRLLEHGDSKCPNCRRIYVREAASFTLPPEEISRLASASRSVVKNKVGSGGQGSKDHGQASTMGATPPTTLLDYPILPERAHLADLRVVQHNLVYAIGIPGSIANEQTMREPEFFGQYGRIIKVSVTKRPPPAGSTATTHRDSNASAMVYVTYSKSEEAAAAISAVDGSTIEGRHIKATYGTTKYCAHYLRGLTCPNGTCLYLHELGDANNTFTKEQMASVAGRHPLHSHLLEKDEAKSARSFGVAGWSNSEMVRDEGQKAATLPVSKSSLEETKAVTTPIDTSQSIQKSPIPQQLPSYTPFLDRLVQSSSYFDEEIQSQLQPLGSPAPTFDPFDDSFFLSAGGFADKGRNGSEQQQGFDGQGFLFNRIPTSTTTTTETSLESERHLDEHSRFSFVQRPYEADVFMNIQDTSFMPHSGAQREPEPWTVFPHEVISNGSMTQSTAHERDLFARYDAFQQESHQKSLSTAQCGTQDRPQNTPIYAHSAAFSTGGYYHAMKNNYVHESTQHQGYNTFIHHKEPHNINHHLYMRHQQSPLFNDPAIASAGVRTKNNTTTNYTPADWTRIFEEAMCGSFSSSYNQKQVEKEELPYREIPSAFNDIKSGQTQPNVRTANPDHGANSMFNGPVKFSQVAATAPIIATDSISAAKISASTVANIAPPREQVVPKVRSYTTTASGGSNTSLEHSQATPKKAIAPNLTATKSMATTPRKSEPQVERKPLKTKESKQSTVQTISLQAQPLADKNAYEILLGQGLPSDHESESEASENDSNEKTINLSIRASTKQEPLNLTPGKNTRSMATFKDSIPIAGNDPEANQKMDPTQVGLQQPPKKPVHKQPKGVKIKDQQAGVTSQPKPTHVTTQPASPVKGRPLGKSALLKHPPNSLGSPEFARITDNIDSSYGDCHYDGSDGVNPSKILLEPAFNNECLETNNIEHCQSQSLAYSSNNRGLKVPIPPLTPSLSKLLQHNESLQASATSEELPGMSDFLASRSSSNHSTVTDETISSIEDRLLGYGAGNQIPTAQNVHELEHELECAREEAKLIETHLKNIIKLNTDQNGTV